MWIVETAISQVHGFQNSADTNILGVGAVLGITFGLAYVTTAAHNISIIRWGSGWRRGCLGRGA